MDEARENVKSAAKDSVEIAVNSFAEGAANNIKSASEGGLENIKDVAKDALKNIKIVTDESAQAIKIAASSTSVAIKDFIVPSSEPEKRMVAAGIGFLIIGGLSAFVVYQGYKYFIPDTDTLKDEIKENKTESDTLTPPNKADITMELNVSSDLAAIIGTVEGEKIYRTEVVKRIWAYLKEHNLRDSENRQFFYPDATMEPVFGNERINAFSMTKYLKKHLSNEAK